MCVGHKFDWPINKSNVTLQSDRTATKALIYRLVAPPTSNKKATTVQTFETKNMFSRGTLW